VAKNTDTHDNQRDQRDRHEKGDLDDHRRPNITDPRAMRALAHPVRLALIEALAVEGTATATRCAELLGESQANCSFHLRQLAKYGFVEEAPSEDRRERPWRLTTVDQNVAAVQPDVRSAVAADHLSRVFLRREADRMLRWVDTHHDEPEEWQHAAFSSALGAPLTAEELREVADRIWEIVQPYIPRIEDTSLRPEGARWVRIFATGFPVSLPYVQD
jgi:DNA-binding MarR family transcriptional regulator